MPPPSLVRPWSSIPLPRSLSNVQTFRSNRAHARTYTVQASNSRPEQRPPKPITTRLSAKKKAALEASSWTTYGITTDALYETMEGDRRANDSAMLTTLESPIFRGFKFRAPEKNVAPEKKIALEVKVAQLSARVAMEKAMPPLHDDLNRRFKGWQEKLQAKVDGMGRKISRAIWRRNKKLAAAVKKNEASRRIVEYRWKADLYAMERTLNQFRYHLAVQMKDGAERAEAMDAWRVEEARLEKEGRGLAEEEKWVDEYQEDKGVQAREARQARREREAKKEEERLAERGLAKVEWDNALANKWRVDAAYAKRHGVTRGDFGHGMEDAIEAATLLSQQAADMKVEELVDRKNALMAALEKEKARIARDSAERTAVQEDSPADTFESLESTASWQEDAGEKELKNAKSSVQQDPKDDKSPPVQVQEVAPQPLDPATEKRIQQLRGISEKIVYLKDAAEDDMKRLKTIAKVEAMLQEMEEKEQKHEFGGFKAQKYDPVLALSSLAEASQAEVEAKRISDAKRAAEDAVEDAAAAVRTEQAEKLLMGIQAIRGVHEASPSESVEPIRNWPQQNPPVSQLTLIDQLKAQLSFDGTVKIDDELTVNVDAEVMSLQFQIRQLSNKLKAMYPMMDTVPYDVWNTERRKTLRIWLKILVWKWQTRDQIPSQGSSDGGAGATEGNSLDVRALLEQNILEHGMRQPAAGRMVRRWAHIFERRELRKAGVELGDLKEEKLDEDELKAEMGWLMTEEETVDQERAQRQEQSEDYLKVAAPPIWDEKRQRGLRRSEGTRNFDATGKRRYCTSARRYRAGSTSFTDSELMRLVQNQAGAATPHIEDAESAAEDPFSNGEIADLLAAVAQGPTSQETIPSEPNALPTNHERTAPKDTAPFTPLPEQTAKAQPTVSHEQTSLPHLTSTGAAHMVSVSTKPHTIRTAIATGTVHFSNATPLSLIHSAQNKKGDVLSVSRIAAIMAAKHTPTLIPLCHPIMITHVGVELHVFEEGFGGVVVESKVQCEGQTGVEMEALTSVMGGALSVVDMCKAVDKGIRIEGVRVVLKEGGRSGTWREEGWVSRGRDR